VLPVPVTLSRVPPLQPVHDVPTFTHATEC
jgi:hypothetical protein